jgi:hypothetical protein
MSSFPQNLSLGLQPQVWLFSDFNGYNQFRQVGYPPYLTMAQKARLERIRQARLLHDGRHWYLFLFEARTQFDFPFSQVNGRKVQLYVPYNILKLISLKSADLLFGDQPSINIEDDIQQQKTADLVERTSLHRLAYNLAVEASVDGEVYIEAVIEAGQTYLRRVDAADIFPEGKIQPDGQYQSYIQYNAKNAGTAEAPDWKLLITHYEIGKITREIKQLDQTGMITPRALTLNMWPQEDPEADDLDPETITGIDRNTITWIPNLLVRDIPVSDYDGLVERQDELNAKQTQISRVQAKHADPKLAMSLRSAGTNPAGEGDLISGYGVHYFDNPDEIPRYITWNAELATAIAERNETRSAILLMSETSPVLLGLHEGARAAHNAYKSVRLEAVNSLTKAQRKAVIWKAALRRAISVAQDLEQTIPGIRYDRGPLGIQMRDGLPQDTDALANEIAMYRGCGAMSVDRAVELQIEDPAAREKELKLLEEEKAAATPSILMAPPGQPGDAGGGSIAADETKTDEVGVAA